MGPDRLFRKVLESFMDDGIVGKVLWATAPNLKSLREAMGERLPQMSRTNKKDLKNAFWGLDVEAADGIKLGIDLEIIKDRPIFRNGEWLWQRLGKPVAKDKWTSEVMIKEWAEREAAFKVIGGGVVLSSFERKSDRSLSLYQKGEEKVIEVRSWRQNEWILALAWRYE